MKKRITTATKKNNPYRLAMSSYREYIADGMRNAFFQGAASAIDISGIRIQPYTLYRRSDYEAIAGDWARVGGYINSSMKKFQNERR